MIMRLVGEGGFEPPGSCPQSRRATELRHSPMFYAFYLALCSSLALVVACTALIARITSTSADATTAGRDTGSRSLGGTSMDTITAQSVGDLSALMPSFERSLRPPTRARRPSPPTARRASQLLAFCAHRGCPPRPRRSAGRTSRASSSASWRRRPLPLRTTATRALARALQFPHRLR